MEEKNTNLAIQLARLFTEEIDLPTRLKNKENKKEKNKTTQKSSENSGIEQRFQDKIKSWEIFIKTMNSKIDRDQASRFLNLNPIIEPNTPNAAYCKDFQDFTDYFVLRRDKEMCDVEELGQLAQLHTAFQKKIDSKINNSKLSDDANPNNSIQIPFPTNPNKTSGESQNEIDWQVNFKNLPIIPKEKRWVSHHEPTLEQLISWKFLTKQYLTNNEEKIFESLSSFYIELETKLKEIDYKSFNEQDFIDFENYIFHVFNYVPFISNALKVFKTYRLVINESVLGKNERITNATFLKQPSIDIVKRINKFNRANTPKTNMFYGSETIDTALKEIKPPLNKLVTIGVWKPKTERKFISYPISHSERAINVNLGVKKATNAFEEHVDYNHKLFIDYLRHYLKILGKEFTKEVSHHYEYIISSLFAERIFKDREIKGDEFKFDCIIYPSVGNDFETSNLAILPSVIDNDFYLNKVLEFEIEESYYNNKTISIRPEQISLAKIKNLVITDKIDSMGNIQW